MESLNPRTQTASNTMSKTPTRNDAEDSIKTLLAFLGEDTSREGLLDTPKRVVKAMEEMTNGYNADVEEILGRTFDVACDEMVVLRNIPFTSLCEHHLLPFTGFACVGYLPAERVVGLSKLARLVHCYAKRLQVQEQLTTQIATALNACLSCKGVGVILTANHACMSCRGVAVSGTEMVTSHVLGAFRESREVRSEFLTLARSHR